MVRRPSRRDIPHGFRAALILALLVFSLPATGVALAIQATAPLQAHRAATLNHAPAGTEAAVYDGDVNVPDGTAFAPGARFTKIWRIKNIGTATWTSAFRWHFEAGTLMSGATLSVPVSPTGPGQSTLIRVPMQAPMAPGVYTSFWQMVDPQGKTFPHQAWVKIVVRSGGATTTPSPTPVPAATTARAVATAPPSQPTINVPGGGGQFVSSAWVGSMVYHAYFPAGSTLAGHDETLGVFYGGPKLAHVLITLFRPDGARRSFVFALNAGQRQVVALDRVAPGTGVAAMVEADRQVVTERVSTAPRGLLLDSASSQLSRTWLFPAIPPGAPSNQTLVLFNPAADATSVTVRVGNQGGGCCSAVKTVTVPPQSQYSVVLGTSPSLAGPLTLSAGAPIAAERLAESADNTTVGGIPGAVNAAKTWYLPTVRGAASLGTVNVFNPLATSAIVTIHSDLGFGSGRWIGRAVGPFSEWRLPLSELTSAGSLSAEVSANGPVVVSASWSAKGALPATALGSTATARDWTTLAGLGGKGTSETIDLVNPSAKPATVSITMDGARGPATSWRITIPPHGGISRALPGAVEQSGATILIHASQPIVAGRGISGNGAEAAVVCCSMAP